MTTQLVEMLARETGADISTLSRLIDSSPVRYKVYSIPKRNGNGSRTIAQPAKEVKLLQRIVVSKWLNQLPVHDAAHAYRQGRGIRTHAAVHMSARYLLKLDFVDFFPSLRPEDLRKHLTKYAQGIFPRREVSELCHLLFWRPRGSKAVRLSIGAPSSPFISNTLVFDVDVLCSTLAAERSAKYTRYADDLCFSTEAAHAMDDLAPAIASGLNGLAYPRLKLNEAKTVFASMKGRRSITGVTLNNDGQLSLGRAKKRLIRAMKHADLEGRLDGVSQRKLQGLLAHANDIEPSFVERLTATSRRFLSSRNG